MNMKYFLTLHSVERLIERAPTFIKKYPELKGWKRAQGVGHLKGVFDKVLENTEEDRSFLNNTAYMCDYYERYGYDSEFAFYKWKEEGIIFVFVKDKDKDLFRMVTTLHSHFRPTVNVTKYNHKETKEKVEYQELNEMYDKYHQTIYPENLVQKKIEEEKEQEKLLLLTNSQQDTSLTGKILSILGKNTCSPKERVSNTRAVYHIDIEGTCYKVLYINRGKFNREIELLGIVE